VVVTLDQATACAAMETLFKRLDKAKPLLESFAGVLRESYHKNFQAGGRPPWAPLKPATVKAKRSFFKGKPRPPYTKGGAPAYRLLQQGKFGSRTILVRTGKLRDSWVQKGATGHVEEVSSDERSLRVGSQLTLSRTVAPAKPLKKYHLLGKKAKAAHAAGQAVSARIPLARFHEEGTSKMPARPVGIVQAEDVALMKKLTVKYIEGGEAALVGSAGSAGGT